MTRTIADQTREAIRKVRDAAYDRSFAAGVIWNTVLQDATDDDLALLRRLIR